jgi:GNAT superfamily N-acetyltransferase
MGEVALVVGEVGDGLRECLDAEINAFNVAATGYYDAALLCISVREDGGDLFGGLSGWTWGGCGYIEFLWVRGDHRGSGLGTRLLAAAEQEVTQRGCDQLALSTHSFQAPGSYARFGYQECGRTPLTRAATTRSTWSSSSGDQQPWFAVDHHVAVTFRRRLVLGPRVNGCLGWAGPGAVVGAGTLERMLVDKGPVTRPAQDQPPRPRRDTFDPRHVRAFTPSAGYA